MAQYAMIANPLSAIVHRHNMARCQVHLVLWDQWRRLDSETRHAWVHAYRELMDRTHCTVIADNGAHEGIMPTDSEYAEFLHALRPSIAVMPDLIGHDSEESLNRGIEFAEDNNTMLRAIGCRRMHAVQGSSRADVVDGYVRALNWMGDEDILGFGQSYLQFCNDDLDRDTEAPRADLYAQVAEKSDGKLYEKPHHILGGRWSAGDFHARYDKAMSLDSVKPLTCALMCLEYQDGSKPTYDFDPRNTLEVVDWQLWEHNINRFCFTYGLRWR